MTNVSQTGSNDTAGLLASATTIIDVRSATAPTAGQVLTATNGSAATWQTPSTTGPWSRSAPIVSLVTTSDVVQIGAAGGYSKEKLFVNAGAGSSAGSASTFTTGMSVSSDTYNFTTAATNATVHHVQIAQTSITGNSAQVLTDAFTLRVTSPNFDTNTTINSSGLASGLSPAIFIEATGSTNNKSTCIVGYAQAASNGGALDHSIYALYRGITLNYATAQTGNVYGINMGFPTITGTATQTIPIAASLRISSAPVAGSNTTLTETYGLLVQAPSKFTGAVRLDSQTVTLGGGSTATLGTIGGSGPATASQNKWVKVNIDGVQGFVPIWV